MTKYLPQFFVLVLIPFLYLGCTAMEKGSLETVTFHSFPSGAHVYANGDLVGITPMSMELRNKTVTGIRVEKPGYKPRRYTIKPVPNENAKDYVKFGILDEFGYYQELSPNPVTVQLVPVELPRSRSLDQFEEMNFLISQIDMQRENGEIDPVEHKYKVEKIIEYFTN